MHDFTFALEVVSVAVILLRSVQIGSRISFKDWNGHPLQFVGTSVSYPLMAGGSVGILLDRHGGWILLLVGVALLMLFERRRAE